MTLALKRCVLKDFECNWLSSFDSPECRLKPQFIYALDKDTDIVTKHFAQDLIDLSGGSLSPNRTPELCFNHGEGGFDIRPLVVVLQEGVPVEVVEVPHPVPQPIELVVVVSRAGGVNLEGDKSRPALSLNRPEVAPVGVRLVSRHFIDVECLGCLVYQWYELAVIGGLIGSSLDTGDNVGFDTANQVGLYPGLLTAFLAVLVVEPSGIGASGEARGVNGKIGLYRPERAGTLLDKGLEQGGQIGVLQVAEGAGERRRLGDQSFSFRFPKVGHEAPAGHCRVDLRSNPEYHISQWQPRTTKPVFRLGYAVAEVFEQGDKPLLLMGLGFIVDRPVLGISHPHSFGHDLSAIGALLSLDNELNRIDVLALPVSGLKVPAGAEGRPVVKVHYVSPVAGLGRDFPTQLVLPDRVGVRYHQSSLLPYFHFLTPFLLLSCIYNSISCMPLSIVFMSILPDFSKLPIDKGICCMLLYLIMNEIQAKIAQLQEKGWTLASIADELVVTPDTVENWRAGRRNATNAKGMLIILDELLKRKRIPKKKRYTKGSR